MAVVAALRKTNPPDGKRAVTHIKVLETFDGFSLVECRLETGRTHQVRIHLGEASARRSAAKRSTTDRSTVSHCPMEVAQCDQCSTLCGSASHTPRPATS